MKYFKFIIPLVVSLVMISSCKKKPAMPEDPIAKFQASLTKEDTITVLELCESTMKFLQDKNYDSAFSTLYELDSENKTVKPLGQETINRYKSRYRLFPVQEYKLEYVGFLHETCNNVKYSVVFATAEQTGGEAAKTSFMFLPVKIDGEWLICLNTSNALTNKDIHNH